MSGILFFNFASCEPLMLVKREQLFAKTSLLGSVTLKITMFLFFIQLFVSLHISYSSNIFKFKTNKSRQSNKQKQNKKQKQTIITNKRKKSKTTTCCFFVHFVSFPSDLNIRRLKVCFIIFLMIDQSYYKLYKVIFTLCFYVLNGWCSNFDQKKIFR